MNNLLRSSWQVSVVLFIAMISTFIEIFTVQRELNLKIAIGYLIVWAVVTAVNGAYIFIEKSKELKV